MLHCKYVILIKITHFGIIFPFTKFIDLAFTSVIAFFSFKMPINDDVSKPIKPVEKKKKTLKTLKHFLNGPNLWNQGSVCSLCINRYTYATNADKLALIKFK